MPKLLSIVASLTIITSICGLALGGLYEGTKDRIAMQVLENKQLPAAQKVLTEARNDLLAEHKILVTGEKARHVVFHGTREGESRPYGVAYQVLSSKGFGGNLGVMVGFDAATGDLLGLFVTTHSETPGIGARSAVDGPFVRQFRGMKRGAPFRVKADGGNVDALTGATVTSRAICDAVNQAAQLYDEHAEEIGEAVGADLAASSEGGGQ